MPLTALSMQNPWWEAPTQINQDVHLQRLAAQPILLRHPAAQRLDMQRAGVYVLRGPRQIGKTTLLKQLVVRLLGGDAVPPRNILFFALDAGNVSSPEHLTALIRHHREVVAQAGRRYLLLDEASYCTQWATAIKVAFDSGLLVDATVVVSGSHAMDLARGSERLPGRRGELEADGDIDMGPYPLRSIGQALGITSDPLPALSWTPADLHATAVENALRCPRFGQLQDSFLLSGGLPLPIGEVAQGGRFSQSSAAVYLQAVVGDLMRAGRKERTVRELAGAVAALAGSPTDWHGLAERFALGSKNTAADYLADMEACYLLTVLPQPRTLGNVEASPRKPRKLHFRDPFLQHVFTAWARGLTDPCQQAERTLSDPQATGNLVEAVVAGQLLPHARALQFWDGQHEIDLLCHLKQGRMLPIEVKYRSRVTPADRKPLARLGGGVVASRQTLAWFDDEGVAVIPLGLLLLSLPRSPIAA